MRNPPDKTIIRRILICQKIHKKLYLKHNYKYIIYFKCIFRKNDKGFYILIINEISVFKIINIFLL